MIHPFLDRTFLTSGKTYFLSRSLESRLDGVQAQRQRLRRIKASGVPQRITALAPQSSERPPRTLAASAAGYSLSTNTVHGELGRAAAAGVGAVGAAAAAATATSLAASPRRVASDSADMQRPTKAPPLPPVPAGDQYPAARTFPTGGPARDGALARGTTSDAGPAISRQAATADAQARIQSPYFAGSATRPADTWPTEKAQSSTGATPRLEAQTHHGKAEDVGGALASMQITSDSPVPETQYPDSPDSPALPSHG